MGCNVPSCDKNYPQPGWANHQAQLQVIQTTFWSCIPEDLQQTSGHSWQLNQLRAGRATCIINQFSFKPILHGCDLFQECVWATSSNQQHWSSAAACREAPAVEPWQPRLGAARAEKHKVFVSVGAGGDHHTSAGWLRGCLACRASTRNGSCGSGDSEGKGGNVLFNSTPRSSPSGANRGAAQGNPGAEAVTSYRSTFL